MKTLKTTYLTNQLFLGAALILSSSSHAGASLHAHVHGHGKVTIIVESATPNQATFQFESPSEAIIGFEHEAKTSADKASLAAAIKKFENNFATMVHVDKNLHCAFAKVKIEPLATDDDDKQPSPSPSKSPSAKASGHGGHSEFRAEFKAICEKALAGTEIQFGFTKIFPRLHEIDVQALVGDKQNSIEVKNDKGKLKL